MDWGGFRWISHRESVRTSAGATLCPYGLPTVGFCGLFLHGSFLKSLSSPLCGEPLSLGSLPTQNVVSGIPTGLLSPSSRIHQAAGGKRLKKNPKLVDFRGIV